MNKIYTSASRLAFLAITLAFIALTFKGVITGEQFMVVAGMVFTYYFTKTPEVKPIEEKTPDVNEVV